MGDELEDDKEDAEELKIQQMTEPEQKGYKDWLAAAAQVIFASHWSTHYNAHFSLVRTSSKRGPSEGADLKKMLFSLNTFFQEDKNLVADFIQVGGLAQLVILGKEDEVQLQNFILRALGQIMLYVDGMQGVMQHIQVSNWSRLIM